MNKQQYAAYEKAVADYLERNKVKCQGPTHPDSDTFFSWASCECCESHPGGNREEYTFATDAGDTFSAEICTDCVYYLAYGHLDDTTMIELAE